MKESFDSLLAEHNILITKLKEISFVTTSIHTELTVKLKHKENNFELARNLQARRQVRLTADVVKDDKLQEERALNICVRGLPEIEQQDDSTELKHVCKFLGPNIEIIDIVSVKRLGKKADGPEAKPRNLIVKFGCKDHRKIILGNAAKLSNSPNFKHIFLGPDLTRMQETEQYELRRRCRELNESVNADPLDSFVIYNNDVIKRSQIPHRR
jgi:hypothetical protein